MSGVLDAQVHIGRETTYGKIAVPTRSIEALEDFATAQREGLSLSVCELAFMACAPTDAGTTSRVLRAI